MADLVLCRRLTNEVVGAPPRYEPVHDAPDGLYVVRSGVATAVTAEKVARAIHMALSQHSPWEKMTPGFQRAVLEEAGLVITALTKAQGGAE